MVEVHLTPDQEAFIRRGIEDGRFQNAGEAVRQALSLWEQRERRRMEILAAVDRAEASLAAGQSLPLTVESMRSLADDIKQRGRARMTTE